MIKLMKSTFYNEKETKKKLCEFIMNSEQLSMGEKCLEFEKKFSEYQGRKYSVFLNSGSSANLALLHSLKSLGIINKGDNVGFSALTWPTNVMPMMQLGFNPIPVDISTYDLNVRSENLETILRDSALKCFFVTNALGFCGDLDKIAEICNERGIVLLEDNCESLGSELNGRKLGSYGLASTFSFFVGHHLSTIEGGMVCTDDGDLYNMLTMVRAHGWDRNLPSEKKNKLRASNGVDDFYSCFSFYVTAFNFRPTEIQGFIGLEQLKYIEHVNKERYKNFLEFHEIARLNPDFCRLELEHMNFISNFAYPLVFKDKVTFENYKERFLENLVEIRPIIGGSVLEQPFFKDYLREKRNVIACPVAEDVHHKGFYFPNNPELDKYEKETLKSLLRD